MVNRHLTGPLSQEAFKKRCNKIFESKAGLYKSKAFEEYGKSHSVELRIKIGCYDLKKCYKLLGLKPSCDHEEIKEVFYQFSLHFHPDKLLIRVNYRAG